MIDTQIIKTCYHNVTTCDIYLAPTSFLLLFNTWIVIYIYIETCFSISIYKNVIYKHPTNISWEPKFFS
jgi:hypothetical protein